MTHLNPNPTDTSFPYILGWDSALESAFAPYRSAGLVPGRIARVDRGLCDVLIADDQFADVVDINADVDIETDAGTYGAAEAVTDRDGNAGGDADALPGVAESRLELQVRERRRKRLRVVRADWSAIASSDPTRNPCTGDWAAVACALDDVVPPSAVGFTAVTTIRALLPRRTAVVRGSAGERSDGQVLAANVDYVLLGISLAAKPDAGRLERLLALAWESGACPVVVLTKADAPHDPAWVDEVVALAPGVSVLVVSALTGAGMDELVALLGSGTAALLGQSGVGKSTLTNALAGSDVMAVASTRSVDEKGRHTTTTRELIPLPSGGALIDTPGLRSVGLFGGEAGVDQAFRDVLELAASCRFADCAHSSEPGCAVTEAVAVGALPQRRLDSYRRLLRENAWVASRSDARVAAERQREWKLRSRSSNPARP
ncbi:ribosome small subunit-dependent GTPase A [Actinospica durhamensis]|uniref:Small ribosomal subunit biogenesis GTPase RsgA n=1 Tax=Actinospica durhamensis TaxID=1508375 RepID=A0A941EXT3_9ACTN|nr:ribosome small subunit-dependent GTPase A [Actinospica durhamensis]MBR7839206.1 ribosome small subunit-dependent GTPase A [Actinospica durhamensis]